MAAAADKMLKFVVVSDAIVVTIGTKQDGKPIFTRVMRGNVVQGPETSEQLQDLLAKGAIKRVRSSEELAEMQADLADPRTSRHRQNVRAAARLQGAPDDPVQLPMREHLPLSAPVPETNPESLTRSVLADDL